MAEKKHKPSTAFLSSEQIRQRVCKDLWIAEPLGQRLHHRIESERSLVTFSPKGSYIEVLEHLFDVRCSVQDKTASKKAPQQFRLIIAKEGLYNYQNQTFTAEDVALSMYKIPGSFFPYDFKTFTPFLQGHADNISLTLQKGSPRFVASHFTASLKES